MRRDENESSHRLVDRVYGYDIMTMHIHTYMFCSVSDLNLNLNLVD